MDRFFALGDYIYDRERPNRRAPFTRNSNTAQNIAIQMNQNDETWADHWSWAIGRDLDLNDPWPDPSEFVDEYAEAVKVLGEDYFA